MTRHSRGAVAVTLITSVLLWASCSPPVERPREQPATAHLLERSHQTMGTELRVSAWTNDDGATGAAIDEVCAEFDRLDGMMTVWREESDVARLNAAAGDRPVRVSRETLEVLDTARQVSEWTAGRFDVTFAALSGLWKFDYQNKDNSIPSRADTAARLSLINYRDLVVDTAEQTAFLKRKGMSVNLGGIGKGYAVDRASAILRRHGLRDFLIQAGGDMYVAGRRGDRPWRLGIQDPRGPADHPFGTVELTDATLSTSGDYERFFIKNGRRYHHIIDVTTGEPATASRSVTLVTERAIIADALAKGAFILGPEAGMALIERVPGVEGVIVGADNSVHVSSGLKDRFTVSAPPTDGP